MVLGVCLHATATSVLYQIQMLTLVKAWSLLSPFCFSHPLFISASRPPSELTYALSLALKRLTQDATSLIVFLLPPSLCACQSPGMT